MHLHNHITQKCIMISKVTFMFENYLLLCVVLHILSLRKENNASAFVVGLHQTMLQIYLYRRRYGTMAETQLKRDRLLDHVSTTVK